MSGGGSEKKFIAEVIEPKLRAIAKENGGLASEPVVDADATIFDEKPKPDDAPKPIVSQIQTANGPGTGALLVSQDGKAILTVMNLTTEYHSHGNWGIISEIEEFVHELEQGDKIPPGDRLYLTGSAVIGRDHIWAEAASARAAWRPNPGPTPDTTHTLPDSNPAPAAADSSLFTVVIREA